MPTQPSTTMAANTFGTLWCSPSKDLGAWKALVVEKSAVKLSLGKTEVETINWTCMSSCRNGCSFLYPKHLAQNFGEWPPETLFGK